MGRFPLKGATVETSGAGSFCVESGDIDFGELNMVETTCSTDLVKTYEPGTFENASGSFTINSTTPLADLLGDFGDGASAPGSINLIFTWPDSGSAAVTVSGFITNVTFPVGVDQSFTATVSFTGNAALSFTA